MDRDEMSNLYSGPSIDASYQVSIHSAEGFQRRRLNCEKFDFVSHFTGTLLMDRDEIVSFRFISFRFVSISFRILQVLIEMRYFSDVSLTKRTNSH
jgi:hypothetical protein